MAYNTKTDAICTLADLHAEQKEFPHCIADGIFVLNEEGVKPGDDMAAVIGADDHVVEFEITPNRPDCLSASSALPGRPAPPSAPSPEAPHPRGQGLRRLHRRTGGHRH